MTISRILAQWISGLTFCDLPESVVVRAKQSVADCFAESVFVGATKPWGRKIATFASRSGGGQPESTIFSSATKTLASRAALANGTMALGYEYADVLWGGSSRPYPFSVPPAFALAELRHRSGQDLIVSIAAAYEIMRRVSVGMSREQIESLVDRRFYPAALVGTFGSAAAAGKAVGLQSDALSDALGIASAVPGGTFHGHFSGTWTRSLQAGIAGERGVTAALLAEQGFPASGEAVEDFYTTFAGGSYDEAAVVHELGESWAINSTWTKAYPLNATLHSSIEALIGTMREYDLHYSEIESIRVWWHMYAKFLANTEVRTPVAAQASLPYAVAAAAVRGRISVEEFTEDSISDPVIQKLMDCVTVEVDSELYDRVAGEGVPARVVVRTTDGREFSNEVLFPKGHPRNPMAPEEFKRKFLDITMQVLPEEQCGELYGKVMLLDEIDDVAELAPMLSQPDRNC